jgi:hypothetical protein
VAKPGAVAREFFKGIARANRTFTLEFGPLRATGVPAILCGVTGIIIAGGVATVLARSAARLPETLREANGLAQTMRGDRPRLNA